MTIASGIVVFVIVWWTVLFAVLPWGVKVPDQVQTGTATSAPERPRLVMKALVTTAITVVIWIAYYVVATLDLVTFSD